MQIIAKPIKAKDLKEGDLFSGLPIDYWDNRDRNVLGERVLIRTEAKCPKDQRNVDLCLLIIK